MLIFITTLSIGSLKVRSLSTLNDIYTEGNTKKFKTTLKSCLIKIKLEQFKFTKYIKNSHPRKEFKLINYCLLKKGFNIKNNSTSRLYLWLMMNL